MKKGLILALIILVLGDCTVQKKNYYVFDRVKLPPPKSGQLKEEQKAEDVQAIAAETGAMMPGKDDLPVVTDVRISRKKLKDLSAEGSTSLNEIADLPTVEGRDSAGEIQEMNAPTFRRPGTGLLFLVAALIGLTTFGLTRARRPVNSLTRWARANPRKAQGLIAGIHLPLLGLGFMNGYNLDKLGYAVSDPALIGCGAATLAGLLFTPLIPKPNFIALPANVNRQRLSFLGIALSSFLLMVGVGNNTDRILPNSRIAKALTAADHAFFSQDENQSNLADQATTSPRERRARMATGGMSAGAAVALIFLLSIVACAGACLVFGGFAAIFSGSAGGLLALLAGVPMLLLAIKGIKQVMNRRFETKLAEMNKDVPPEK